MRRIQVKIFHGELTGSIQDEVNLFLTDKDVYRITTVHAEQGCYIYVLIFYYTAEIVNINEDKISCETRIFQGPAGFVEERVNAELKKHVFKDISLSKGWGDYLKVVLIVIDGKE